MNHLLIPIERDAKESQHRLWRWGSQGLVARTECVLVTACVEAFAFALLLGEAFGEELELEEATGTATGPDASHGAKPFHHLALARTGASSELVSS